MMTVTTCPTCGSKKIRRKVIDLQMTVKGRTKTVRGLELEVCPVCGEKLFDAEASAKVDRAFHLAKRKAAAGKGA